MKKQTVLLPLLLTAALTLTACKNKPVTGSVPPSAEPSSAASAYPNETTADTDSPAFTVDPFASVAFFPSENDSSFDNRVWAGVQSFCQSSGKKCFSYSGTSQASESNSQSSEVEQAIAAGHKIMIISGDADDAALYSLQEKYPEVAFLFLNGSHHSDENTRPGFNAVSVRFAEEELGYLAGYAAVGDGFTRLGFLGSLNDPAQIRYGYGFVQGVNDAARSAGITADLLYYYADPLVYFASSNETTQSVKTVADLWYRSGIQLIFSSSALGDDFVIAAAEENGGKVITTQGALAQQPAAVLAVAEPSPTQIISRILSATYGNRFPGGQEQILGCTEQAIDLDFSRMAKFGQYDYEHAYGKLAAGTVTLLRDDAVLSPDQLPAENVNVNFIEG